MKQPAVYMLASRRNGTIYTGVTSNLPRRVWEHKQATKSGFTKAYSVHMLVWMEFYERMTDAIAREKQIKGGSRAAKLRLIEAGNPSWRDLYEDLYEDLA